MSPRSPACFCFESTDAAMISLALSTTNQRERQILNLAFEQRHVKVFSFEPTYAHYIKMLQYLPDIVFIELPHVCADQIHFISLLKKHKKLKRTEIVGYGNKLDTATSKGLKQVGITNYFDRPLKFTVVMVCVAKYLKSINKELAAAEEKSDKFADEKLLLAENTLPTKKIEIMVRHVSQMLAFPFTVAKVLKLTRDETSGAGDLAKVIEADPVISTNILKVSNTVFFASASRRISSIKDAIVRIGFNETKRIVMSMSVMELFDNGENRNFGFDRIDFWYHCLATGIVSEKLAKRMGLTTDDAFLAGLLHDFGIILLDEFFPQLFSKILDATASEGAQFIDKEAAILKVHHNDLVQELFTHWKMPQPVTDAVVHQYSYAAFEPPLEDMGKKLALCVGVGNVLAKAAYLGRECDQFVRPVPNHIFSTVKLAAGFTPSFMEEVYNDIAMYRQFLKLEEREFPVTYEGLDNPEEMKVCIVNSAQDIFVAPQLYLAKAHLPVELIRDQVDSENLHGKYTIIILWADSALDAELVQKLARIKAVDGDKHTPLLVCLRDNQQLPKSESMSGISCMDQNCDIRKFDRNVSSIFMGNAIEYEPYVVERSEIALVSAESESGEAQQEVSDASANPEQPSEQLPAVE
ncbi:MAG: HDOD domain-containing protein [Chitinivibrionales bacterium]|nr:HDOD domain-containing protein [Chitinivibrionales bacterium]